MSKLLEQARSLAEEYHKNQMYGIDTPYTTHLDQVVGVLIELGYGDNEELLAAGYLHDVLEDNKEATPAGLLMEGMPVYTVALVDAVTDQEGKNRKERKLKTYPRIARIPDAITLKLADRIANVRECVRTNCVRLLSMYQEEFFDFHNALYVMNTDRKGWMILYNILFTSIYRRDIKE